MAGPGRRLILAGALVAAGVATLAVLALSRRNADLRPANPDPNLYPVRGIDVSHHNGTVAWRRVKQAGVGFAWIKASEGADFVDEAFARNAQGAARAGLPAGAYHFFTLCAPGEAQARNFLQATATARLRLPPAIDLEFAGNCAQRPSRKAFAHALAVYVRDVRKATGQEPVLYVTTEFYDAYLINSPFQRRALWLRDVRGDLDRPLFSRVAWWQFASAGAVNGVDGPVDLNVFVGDTAAFRAELAP